MMRKKHNLFYLWLAGVFSGLCLMAGTLAGVTQVQAIEYENIGGRPAYPRAENLRSQSIFIHTATAGAVLQEAVDAINNTKSNRTLMVYATDSTPSSGGGFACEQMVEDKDEVGAWITLNNDVVDVPSMSKIRVPFTIALPTNLDAGEYNGCIVIQEQKPPEKKEGGISLSTRTGLRVALTVPGEIIRRLSIVDFTVHDLNRLKVNLRPKVKNEGNVSVDADVEIITRNIFNRQVNQIASTYPVLKRDTSEWNFEFKRAIWGGRYKSQLIVRYFQDEEKTNQVTLMGPNITFYTWPTAKGALIEFSILLLVVGLKLYAIRSIKRRRQINKAWKVYTVSARDTVQSLAKKHQTSWQKLARVNRLKPPYELQKGQTIKVPPIK